jgi:hypothetical protein
MRAPSVPSCLRRRRSSIRSAPVPRAASPMRCSRRAGCANRAGHKSPELERLPDPLQLEVRAGDLVLAHYQLGHTGAPNLSAHVRYAFFFRLYHEHHDADSLDILADIQREFLALRRFRDAG